MTPRPRHFVTYYRVSTQRQGKSGLGLDAQRAAVKVHLDSQGGLELATFTEVESGKVNGRPQLDAALRRCRQTRATLLVAKLDRLSRNAAFLLSLRDAGVRVVAADNPEMNETVVGIMAVIAQHEAQAISDRTRAALAAAKRRGVRLGNPHLKAGTPASARAASVAAQAAAKSRAEELRDVVSDAHAAGCVSLRDVAQHLNGLGIRTARGGDWAAASVLRLLRQLSA
ncbi:MAG TPA: recombinase family protein [Steroidobacteraceae bacterium]|jgi:DNA invertase Pin-like site-specific DNA recombinase|nr:recombinase family protein [Steroidobacteraceae bacterium]